MRFISLTLGSLLVLTAATAAAQPYADPPYGDPGGPVVARPYYPPDPYPPPPDDDYSTVAWRRSELSVFRFHVGGAGRVETEEVTPGFLTAIDIGRGPAGFRASGMWLRVGSDGGVAQYTGELTLDLGGTHSWRPVVGAGAGLARLYTDAADGSGTEGASLGVGVMRVGIEYLIPVERTDTRAGLNVMGVLPAIRSEDAPDPKPWLVFAATVGVGF